MLLLALLLSATPLARAFPSSAGPHRALGPSATGSSTRGTGSSTSMSALHLPGSEDASSEDAIGAPVGPLPSVSSRINYESNSALPRVDLWVVGAGTLGELAVAQWKVIALAYHTVTVPLPHRYLLLG